MTGHPPEPWSGRVDGWMVGQTSRQTVSDLQWRYESVHLRSQLRASRLTNTRALSFSSQHLLSPVDDFVALKAATISLNNNNAANNSLIIHIIYGSAIAG